MAWHLVNQSVVDTVFDRRLWGLIHSTDSDFFNLSLIERLGSEREVTLTDGLPLLIVVTVFRFIENAVVCVVVWKNLLEVFESWRGVLLRCVSLRARRARLLVS